MWTDIANNSKSKKLITQCSTRKLWLKSRKAIFFYPQCRWICNGLSFVIVIYNVMNFLNICCPLKTSIVSGQELIQALLREYTCYIYKVNILQIYYRYIHWKLKNKMSGLMHALLTDEKKRIVICIKFG